MCTVGHRSRDVCRAVAKDGHFTGGCINGGNTGIVRCVGHCSVARIRQRIGKGCVAKGFAHLTHGIADGCSSLAYRQLIRGGWSGIGVVGTVGDSGRDSSLTHILEYHLTSGGVDGGCCRVVGGIGHHTVTRLGQSVGEGGIVESFLDVILCIADASGSLANLQRIGGSLDGIGVVLAVSNGGRNRSITGSVDSHLARSSVDGGYFRLVGSIRHRTVARIRQRIGERGIVVFLVYNSRAVADGTSSSCNGDGSATLHGGVILLRHLIVHIIGADILILRTFSQ